MRVSLTLSVFLSLTPLTAFAQFDGERALMRQCVSDRETDPEIQMLGLSEFCSCLINEVAADADANPDLYFQDEKPKSYYSSKEINDTAAQKQAALAGHERYCTTILTRPASSYQPAERPVLQEPTVSSPPAPVFEPLEQPLAIIPPTQW